MVSSLNISVLFWVLFVCFAWIEVHLCCVEEERIGLLKLKEAFDKYPNRIHPFNWGIEEETDCCKWDYVKCDPITNRVLQLYLNRTIYSPIIDNLYLNLSLFHPFQELQNLYLFSNSFKGFYGILTSKKLQKLDLSGNMLNEIPSLGTLNFLKYLNLGYNHMKINCSNVQELLNLRSLESLDLEYNSWTGFRCVLTSSKLQRLNLRRNNLQDIPSLGMHSLKHLNLGFNNLNSSSNFQGICMLKNLQELDLGENQFSGAIPSCLNNLTSLKLLDLSENNFVGTIPSTLFLNLKYLEYVSLSYNHFEGSFSLPTSFGNNSKLEVFELGNHNNRLEVYTDWIPSFQLKVLQISNCDLNNVNFLVNQYDLRSIILNDNKMVGNFPNWMLINNTNLEYLSLVDNFFTGQFSLPPDTRNLDMFGLDISVNQLHGEFPNFIGSVLPNLRHLNMSVNEFQGFIPPSIGDMKVLWALDLSNNNLSGDIPELLLIGCTSLEILKLSNNSLQGSLLPVNSNLSSLKYLSLDNNYFSGVLLPGLIKSTLLELLDISNNTISGEIPDWLGNFSQLRLLVLSRNSFESHITDSICRLQKLTFLDLSHNRFYGVIPSCDNLTSLTYLHLQGNKFFGPLPRNLIRSSFLVSLDLRDNKFSGKVPDWISSLSHLRILLLKENNFNGSIPLQICRLKNICILDMSFNNFSGMIPTCLSQISFGAIKQLDYEFYQIKNVHIQYDINLKYSYSDELHIYQTFTLDSYYSRVDDVKIEFMSKRRSESYTGYPLDYMSGLDLSGNKLTGPIPNELGNLTYVNTLNLSHNHLSGPIPSTLSKLKQIQSLDLSYNMLSGRIPSELTELNFLSTFSVAYNNLSGRLPDRKAQFGTFDESSYEGNSLLCGSPLKKSCINSDSNGQDPSNVNSGKEDYDSFRDVFLLSFLVSFAAAFLGVISFLYISVYYRRRLFAFIEAKFGVCQCILLKLLVITRNWI